MTQLYLGFALLLLLAVVLAMRTLSLRSAVVPANETRRDKNVELYRLHLADLEQQRTRGEIDDDQFGELQEDLQRNLLAEVPAGGERIGAAVQGRGLLWLVIFLVPLVAVPIYLHVGADDELRLSQWLAERETLQMEGKPVPEGLYRKLERGLERQVERSPQNLDYRVLAARLALEQDRPAQAEVHYQAALQVLPDNPMLLLEWAQARFAATSTTDDSVREALETVLQADPMNRVALEMMGIYSFENQQFEHAMHYWGIALRQSSPASQRAETLWHGIQQARGRLSADEHYRIEARIELDDTMTADPKTAVFLVVRRQGATMPVLAQRYQVGDLPLEITFDNSMSMLPGSMLDDNSSWEVVARVSQQGTATPASGDLEGISEPLNLPLKGSVEVIIDSRRE